MDTPAPLDAALALRAAGDPPPASTRTAWASRWRWPSTAPVPRRHGGAGSAGWTAAAGGGHGAALHAGFLRPDGRAVVATVTCRPAAIRWCTTRT